MNWDDYFMNLCKHVALKSKDPSTKHGSIIVDPEHNIISTGFNGPPRGVDDSIVPLTRPEKYSWFCHSEINSLTTANRTGSSLKDCTIYQTGPSCKFCWLAIANSGIRRQVCGSLSSNCVSEEDIEVQRQMAKMIGIEQVFLNDES